jgi:hypothetical protein
LTGEPFHGAQDLTLGRAGASKYATEDENSHEQQRGHRKDGTVRHRRRHASSPILAVLSGGRPQDLIAKYRS